MNLITSNHRPKVSLVIGADGLKCAAALGLLKVLQEEGIEVEMVVGYCVNDTPLLSTYST